MARTYQVFYTIPGDQEAIQSPVVFPDQGQAEEYAFQLVTSGTAHGAEIRTWMPVRLAQVSGFASPDGYGYRLVRKTQLLENEE